MRVTIQLPDDISAALEEQWDDVPRRSLEAIAVEGYRTGALTEPQVRRLLELDTRFQVHALLKEHHRCTIWSCSNTSIFSGASTPRFWYQISSPVSSPRPARPMSCGSGWPTRRLESVCVRSQRRHLKRYG